MTAGEVVSATLSYDVHFTPAELCQRWRNEVSLKTLAQWRSRGFGPKFLKLGTSVVYPAAEVIAWENARLKSGTRGA
jgi:hypothetical protein